MVDLKADSHVITCMLVQFFCGGFFLAERRVSCRHLHAKRVFLRLNFACREVVFLVNTCILARSSYGKDLLLGRILDKEDWYLVNC